MVQNAAARIPAAKAQLEVKDAPVGKVEAGHLLVKVQAVSIQPVDWKIQDYDFFVKKYPFILGTDVAGEVEEVGEGVKNVKKGNRVLAHCKSLATGNPEHSAFQKFAVVDALLASKIPSSVSFEQATVLPLALSTAATGLYQSTHLNLPHPKPDSPNPEGKGKVILVYGGSSSVGTAAIQLAVASGLSVVTTCSPANFDLVKSLGAVAAVDYKSSSVTDDLVKAIEKAGNEFAGVYDAISEKGSFEICGEVAMKVFGGKGKHYIAATLQPPEKLPGDVKSAWVFALDVVSKDSSSVARAVYHDFVPLALERGTLKCKPDPLVAGEGLKDVQKGLDVQKKGVSAKKVVVSGIQI